MSAPRDITIWLQDIQDAADEAQQFLQGTSLEDYLSDRMRCLAVERLLLLIGDAGIRVGGEDAAAAALLTDLPKIIALRNRIANGYWLTDHHLVHGLQKEVLPRLMNGLRVLLAEVDRQRGEEGGAVGLAQD